VNAGLRTLFALATHAPWALRPLRPVATRLTLAAAPGVRAAVEANARRLLGRVPHGFARDVVGSFYDFVTDLARAGGLTPAGLRRQVVAVEGREHYLALRRAGGGAVLVTAHMGSFEVGLAALRDVEDDVHVVFKRDAFDGFETLRRRVRRTLGVHEAAIDDGLPVLLRLRDTLRANGVVVLQADRAMPGQKSAPVPFAGGHLRVPLGPLKLAQAAGCPVVPVFAVREGAGRVRVWLGSAIDPAADDAPLRMAAAVETFVRRHPTQWLVLHRAFVEDNAVG
jgi:phosphatidylinositol dimannoside acyltransferase